MANDIWGFFNGVLNLIHLRQTLETYQKYFQSSGEFEKAEQGVLNLMKFTAMDIFNLANSSRSAIY